jgi:hypothetical protein
MAQVLHLYRSSGEDQSCDCIRRMVVEVNASVLASFAIKAPAIKGMIWPSIWLHGTFGRRDSWVARMLDTAL